MTEYNVRNTSRMTSTASSVTPLHRLSGY